MSDEKLYWSLSRKEHADFLRKEIRLLKDENARLRERELALIRDFDEQHAIYRRLSELYDEVAAERNKLRELAGALLTSHDKMCTQRGHCFGCAFFYEEVKACPYVKISRALREMGIEVKQ